VRRLRGQTRLGSRFTDIENRLASAGGDSYAYAPDNKRIWKKKPDGSEEFYFYGISGQKLGTYRLHGKKRQKSRGRHFDGQTAANGCDTL